MENAVSYMKSEVTDVKQMNRFTVKHLSIFFSE